MNKRSFSPLSLAILFGVTVQTSAMELNPNYSLILDGHYKSQKSALSDMDKGFGLGHVELSISSPVDNLFFGKLTAVVHTHDNKTELEAEEAFVQTLSLPGGFSVRAGRFLSDFGYLNGQHTHTDAFTERPAVYRALLGSHYYDDGVRVSALMPTDLYWNIGAEAFSGDKMRAEGFKDPKSVGVYSLFTKMGGDFNHEHSWQIGFNYLHNENGMKPVDKVAHSHHKNEHDEHKHDHEHHHDEHGHDEHENNHDGNAHDHHHHGHKHGHDHHCHNVSFTGKHLYGVEAVWKWAPEGNYKYRNLSLSAEYLQAHDIADQKKTDKKKRNDKHDGWYLSSVYQFTPQWTAGVRYGEFNGQPSDSDHQHDLKETDLMLSWSHSHFSTIRLQWTQQRGDGFKSINDNIVTLQYIMSLGAHDAHQF